MFNPRKQSLGVYKDHHIRLFVLPSVRLSVFVRWIFFWRFLLHTNTVYALRVCRDIDPIFFGHGQCHWQKYRKIRVHSISFLRRTLEILTLHKYCLWPEGVPITWPNVILAWSRSFEEEFIFVSALYCFMEKTLDFL